jgi:hypothetical protein
MRKKALCAILSVAMVASMFVACGSDDKKSGDTTPAATKGADENKGGETTNPTEDVKQPEADTGKVFNIYCWNEEFKSRITDHYKDYEKVDDTHGKIGDVAVNWIITPSDDNAYQNKLDADLPKNADAAADDKIDLFLIEADYALKYVDTDYVAAIEDLGISKNDIADQYAYTQQVVTDSKGKIKALSWQGCPGIMFYNRLAAKDILGTDDADKVQEKVKDWDSFKAFAKEADAKGYDICSTVNDTYRVYSNNVSSPWVKDGKVQIDPNIKKWVDDSKELVDAGYTTTYSLWSDEWKLGFYEDGKVFSYFGPAWLINFCMNAKDETSLAGKGQWGACVGPQSFFWGGTWICGTSASDNKNLIKDIMLKMTADEAVLKEIVEKDDDFTNNKKVMEEMAKSTTYKSAVFGGINPLQMYCDGVAKIDLSNLSKYDQGLTETFQTAMKDYFDGKGTYEDAVGAFITAAEEKYPALDFSGLQ